MLHHELLCTIFTFSTFLRYVYFSYLACSKIHDEMSPTFSPIQSISRLPTRIMSTQILLLCLLVALAKAKNCNNANNNCQNVLVRVGRVGIKNDLY